MTTDGVLRVSEVYPSVQGEGPMVGAPTTFVRFGGCNLRCPLWPCDTPHAIDPDKFRHEWIKHSPDDLAARLEGPHPKNICLTGGEPFLQNHDALRQFINVVEAGKRIEAFTNGTVVYPHWAFELVNLVVDWKLPGSGEATGLRMNNPRLEEARRENLDMMRLYGGHSIKFTISDQEDFETAAKFYKSNLLFEPVEVYAGIVWGKEMTNEGLVNLILAHKLDWKLNVQVHNHIWDRSKRGI